MHRGIERAAARYMNYISHKIEDLIQTGIRGEKKDDGHDFTAVDVMPIGVYLIINTDFLRCNSCSSQCPSRVK